MSETQKYFEENGYVVLSNALSKERCDFLSSHMFKLYEENKLTKDVQCPLSDAIYGDPELDKLLEEFCKPIGANVGRKLLPTYTYARIYRPGEILKKHKDRPSCEISATLTLGYDGKNVWPIFFDEEKCVPVALEVGEMAVYKGCDVVHWRDSFKGNWHIQVFLHYVDANGPYSDHVFDKRKELSHHNNIQQNSNEIKNKNVVDNKNQINQQSFSIPKPIHNSVIIPSTDKDFPGFMSINSHNLPELMFTQKECDDIISIAKDSYAAISSVGGTKDKSRVNRSIRSAEIYSIDNTKENRWIYEKVGNIVSVANSLHFNYDIAGILHELQLIHYKSDSEIPGHYDWHTDCGPGEPATRKISLTVQLSDPNDYEGCTLLVNDNANIIEAPKERGSVNLFPSYALHKVCPIEKGERYSLVIWIHGTRRFK